MPELLHARAPQDKAEEQKVSKLVNSRHAGLTPFSVPGAMRV
jgi:hypothetical protein